MPYIEADKFSPLKPKEPDTTLNMWENQSTTLVFRDATTGNTVTVLKARDQNRKVSEGIQVEIKNDAKAKIYYWFFEGPYAQENEQANLAIICEQWQSAWLNGQKSADTLSPNPKVFLISANNEIEKLRHTIFK